MKTKIVAMYLPQYHQIPENDEFWGKGFTDWVTVKNSRPIFNGHIQPKIPLGEKYYDLSIKEDVEWQLKIAKDYGIDCFGVYHYWFNNEKNLLTKPTEHLRDANNPGVNYFFVWDNSLWKRSWSNVAGNDWAPTMDNKLSKDKETKVLIPYILGEEKDWENHYRYLRIHFLSGNYEKYNNKPLFAIINYNKKIGQMCRCWDELAKKDGFDGICFIFKNQYFFSKPYSDFVYNYEPHYSGSWENTTLFTKLFGKVKRVLGVKDKTGVKFYSYDEIWNKILNNARKNNKPSIICGAFVSYDDSPRRGASRAKIVMNATPGKFHAYFNKLYEHCITNKKPYIFLTAWNEWGEGAYLEPDSLTKFEYLSAIKDIVHNTSLNI